MELIDTHCHLTFKELADDIEAVLERSREASVKSWIAVGADTEHNTKVVELADRFEKMYAAVGIHPHFAKSVAAEDLNSLKQLTRNNNVVAIGETGLDFHYNFSAQRDQERLFVQHLGIACELNLPVIVHSRNAFDSTIDILEQFGGGVKKVVFHCFSGSAQQAEKVLDRGYYISFTGVVTFKNAENIRRAAEIVPLARLMIETDCPYMSPEPMRKQNINEPALLVHTAEFLSKLKDMSLEDFAAGVAETSRDFFLLPQSESV